MADEIKNLKQHITHQRLVQDESLALEHLLLERADKEIKIPTEPTEEGWKLKRIEKHRDISYDEIDADKPGNIYYETAQQLAVTLDMIYVFSRKTGSGGFFLEDDEEDDFFFGPDQDDDNDDHGGGKKRRPRPDKDGPALQQGILSRLLKRRAMRLGSCVSNNNSQKNIQRFAENPLIHLRALPEAEELQQELLLEIALLPSLKQKLPFLFATQMIAPENKLYVEEASSMLNSDYLFSAETPPEDKLLASLAKNALVDPAFIKTLSISATQESNLSTPLKHMQNNGLLQKTVSNDVSKTLANERLFDASWDSSEIMVKQMVHDYKPVPFSFALFQEQQPEITQELKRAYATARQSKTNLANTNFKPTASFFTDVLGSDIAAETETASAN
jgi:hypothetical protein